MEYRQCSLLRLLQVPEDRIHCAAVTCGDASRFHMFSEHGVKYKEFGQYLCYKAAELEVDGEMLLLVCHGVSGTSTAPIVRELLEMGVKVIIRSGTAGCYKPGLYAPGDICIVYAAIRDDTTTVDEVNIRYPAVADYDVVDCLVETSEELGINANLGIAYTTDLYFNSIVKPDITHVFSKNCLADIGESEMASIFVTASLYGGKACGICTVLADISKSAVKYSIDYGKDNQDLSWSYLVAIDRIIQGIHNGAKLVLKSASKMTKRIKNPG